MRLAAAEAYVRCGKAKLALQETEIVLQAVPTSADARGLRADAFLVRGDVGEALVEIRHAINREKKAWYFAVLARAQEHRQHTAEATDAYAVALKLDPSNTEWRLQRAKLLIRGGAVKDGLKEISLVLKNQPKLGEAHLYKGMAESDLRRERAALVSFQRAILYQPTLAEAHMRLAQIHNDNRRFAPAAKHLQLAIKHSIEKNAVAGRSLLLVG